MTHKRFGTSPPSATIGGTVYNLDEEGEMQPANRVSTADAMAAYSGHVRSALVASGGEPVLSHHEIEMVRDAFRQATRYDVIAIIILADRLTSSR